MHRTADWVSFHEMNIETVQDVLQAFQANALAESPWHWSVSHLPHEGVQGSLQRCFDLIVCPALIDGLDPRNEHGLRAVLDRVVFAPAQEATEGPHAVFDATTGVCRIAMRWQGTPADVLCLAHEAGHAAQFGLSGTDRMPPIARETCAFLAELMVIDFVQEHNAELCAGLRAAWDVDNDRYLGDDVDDLLGALKDPETPYHYRMNYPLARLASVNLVNSGKGSTNAVLQLFASGVAGMDHLCLNKMAMQADSLENYLPPFAAPDTGALEAFRALGAMALLDIDRYEGASEREIGTVYDDWRSHLESQTVHIAFRPDRRPFGYATWTDAGGAVRVTGQSAPFGDHLALQRSLQRRLGPKATVWAQAPRSARQEQAIW